MTDNPDPSVLSGVEELRERLEWDAGSLEGILQRENSHVSYWRAQPDGVARKDNLYPHEWAAEQLVDAIATMREAASARSTSEARVGELEAQRDEVRELWIDLNSEYSKALALVDAQQDEAATLRSQRDAALGALKKIIKAAHSHARGDLHGTWLDGLELVERIAFVALHPNPPSPEAKQP